MDTNSLHQDEEQKNKEARRTKFFIIIAMFSLAFVFTGFPPFYLVVFYWFPVGLFYWLEFGHEILIFVGWLIYIGLSTAIIRKNDEKLVRILFIALGCLLIFNVHGCRVIDANYW